MGCEKEGGLQKIGLQSCPRVCWDPMELVPQHGGHGELQPLAETHEPRGSASRGGPEGSPGSSSVLVALREVTRVPGPWKRL